MLAVVAATPLQGLPTNTICDEEDESCLNDQPTASSDSVRSVRLGPRLLGPLPDPHENIGEPVPEYSEITDEHQLYGRPAGAPCTVDNDCQNGYSCLPLIPIKWNTHGTGIETIVSNNKTITPILVCSYSDCQSKCAKLSASGPNGGSERLYCPQDSYIMEMDNEDDNCCVQT